MLFDSHTEYAIFKFKKRVNNFPREFKFKWGSGKIYDRRLLLFQQVVETEN